MKTFNFSIHADLTLDVDMIWPDGDAPEDPTVDDVLAVIKACGGKDDILNDWDLLRDVDLTISDGKDSKDAT